MAPPAVAAKQDLQLCVLSAESARRRRPLPEQAGGGSPVSRHLAHFFHPPHNSVSLELFTCLHVYMFTCLHVDMFTFWPDVAVCWRTAGFECAFVSALSTLRSRIENTRENDMEKPSTPLREGVEGFLPMSFQSVKDTQETAGRKGKEPMRSPGCSHLHPSAFHSRG